MEAQDNYSCTLDPDKICPFGGLHWAFTFGIVGIVVDLVEAEGCDINQQDCMGNTPLGWAACNGHEEVVEILLGRNDIDPNKPDWYGATPLCLAARNRHEGVVKILLGRGDVDPNNQIIAAEHRSGVLQRLGTKGW